MVSIHGTFGKETKYGKCEIANIHAVFPQLGENESDRLSGQVSIPHSPPFHLFVIRNLWGLSWCLL
jgi:hypothetical protein